MTLLSGLRVVDASTGIAGPYATKLLADAGADVVKLEPEGGDELRRWSASGHALDGCDGALFRFLNTSKRSVVGGVDGDEGAALVAGADVLVESGTLTDTQVTRLRQSSPRLVVVSVTPFGRTGPFASVPATEFTLQAWCGSTAGRGTADRPPLHAGGRFGEWIAGTYTGAASLAAVHGGRGEHVDVSTFECMAVTLGSFGAQYASFSGSLEAAKAYPGPFRTLESPSIVPTADGLVGFCTVTGQQFQDFLVVIDRPDLLGDERYASAGKRIHVQAEFDAMVREWTASRTTAEIIDLASAFRIPVTEVGTPETIVGLEQFVARRVYVRNPGGGFQQPRVPYRIGGVDAAPFRPAPHLGADRGATWSDRPAAPAPSEGGGAGSTPVSGAPSVDGSGGDASTGGAAGRADGPSPPGRPLDGIRIVDLTAFWAGPSATQLLAALGADVIKVEGLARPDGMRFNATKGPDTDRWWEWGPIFHAVNTGKRAVTLDLGTDEGRQLVFDLIETADGVIENFSPRVLDTFGITWEAVSARNPQAIMVRMPSFGLDGPWRDRTGFAQTMEQVSGLAWVTGYPDDVPVIPRGPCDPLAGMHAAFAFLGALEERRRSGVGRFVEVAMVEAALNVAAEVVIEHTAYGAALHRAGNRGPVAAPQGVYACAGTERWLALAVTDDDQWAATVEVLRAGAGAGPEASAGPRVAHLADERLATEAGRRAHHDHLDEVLTAALADRDRDEVVDRLLAAGVPAAPVLSTMAVLDHPQVTARGFVEVLDHPLAGSHPFLGLPFRLAGRTTPWYERPAPTLGQHNHEVLTEVLGLTDDQVAALEADGVIGTRVPG